MSGHRLWGKAVLRGVLKSLICPICPLESPGIADLPPDEPILAAALSNARAYHILAVLSHKAHVGFLHTADPLELPAQVRVDPDGIRVELPPIPVRCADAQWKMRTSGPCSRGLCVCGPWVRKGSDAPAADILQLVNGTS